MQIADFCPYQSVISMPVAHEISQQIVYYFVNPGRLTLTGSAMTKLMKKDQVSTIL